VVSVAITGHGTLATLAPALAAEAARHGVEVRPFVADFDSYVLDLADPDSDLYRADLVLCVLDPAIVFDEVPTPWRPEDVRDVLDAKIQLIAQLAGQFHRAGRGTLVLNTIPLPREFTAQLVGYRSRAQLGAMWRDANASLLRLADTNPALVILDIEPLVAEGIPVTDARLDVYAKLHLSPALLARYAREVGHLVRHLAGATKKCLALDLDETVWGGVLGEVGADGVEVADGYRGEAFRAFQKVVRQLGSQGVLVTAVSKNDLDPVLAVLRDHPGMTLREADFVRVVANWRTKAENLLDLARDLDLAVDSFVFVDDNATECGLVAAALPGVAVVQLDDEPALHVTKLLQDNWFDVFEVTADDRRRPARYRARTMSLAGHLDELEVRVRLADVAEGEVARVSQLTLRTNQFNLTTERLHPGQVRGLMADPATRVLAIHASDRFGDNGLVGAVFLRRDGRTVYIDNFLLSCRVFSRRIEHACLASVLRLAHRTTAAEVIGKYRPTAKNSRFRDFYPDAGFRPVTADGPSASAGTGAVLTFRHDLTGILAPPPHVQLEASS
jgi:FkbH-like protein